MQTGETPPPVASSAFGDAGRTVNANASSWKRHPFNSGVPVPCSLSFPLDDFERIQSGLVPREMEDKWFIYYDAPFLFFHRSWTGQPVYRLKFSVRGDRALVDEALISHDVAESAYDEAYDARLLDFLISNLLLGKRKPFPVPADMHGVAGVYQHHVSGTGYPEQVVPARKAWWTRCLLALRRVWKRSPQA